MGEALSGLYFDLLNLIIALIGLFGGLPHLIKWLQKPNIALIDCKILRFSEGPSPIEDENGQIVGQQWDPDFWINPVSVWGICGPYVRTSLEPDDIVFFLPKQISWKKACLDDYICTGVLVVDRKLTDRNAVMSENQLTATYKRSWEKDLDIHLIRDRREAPRTVNIRGRNFIIGDNEKSKWFGKNEKYLKEILMDIGLTIYANSLNNRRIKNIHGNNAKLLYNALIN